jgi:hypothetical protein
MVRGRRRRGCIQMIQSLESIEFNANIINCQIKRLTCHIQCLYTHDTVQHLARDSVLTDYWHDISQKVRDTGGADDGN